MLDYYDHSRDRVGLTYIYPVLSRRSGGLSIGINLNPNSACNWQCVYCQVPNLIYGKSPPIDLDRLASELESFLTMVCSGEFYKRESVPISSQQIIDFAISGNGEPTSAQDFSAIVDVLFSVVNQFPEFHKTKWVLITNGSLVERETVKMGLKKLSCWQFETWFKIDSVTISGQQRINKVYYKLPSIFQRLRIVSKLCPVWIQTCLLQIDGRPPDEVELSAYIDFLNQLPEQDINIAGVMLYGLARPSQQPDRIRLSKLQTAVFAKWEKSIRQLDLAVKLTP